MEIAKKRKGLSPIVVSELTGLHYNTARNELEKMEYVKILTHNTVKEGKNYIDVYWFSDYFLRIMSGVVTVHNMVK
jgi:predicted transcriptional regulator